ncbi:putative zinc-binding protein [Niveibacterium sp.]|uniref:putative zinc-binding protein n=1 Tax=Niveibacterium sp. TaxID=2017444 RepID=UPI0035B2F4E1
MSCQPTPSGKRICAEGAAYLAPILNEPTPRVAVMSCEGACAKGEIARVTANLVSYRLARDSVVRLCLGDAVTADSGFSEVVQRAPWVVSVEGCPLCCGSRILRTRFPDVAIRAVVATQYYDYDASKFEIHDLAPGEADAIAQKVAPQTLDAIHPVVNNAAVNANAATSHSKESNH